VSLQLKVLVKGLLYFVGHEETKSCLPL